MTYRVIITPEAETDLRTTYRYIRSQSPARLATGFAVHARARGVLPAAPRGVLLLPRAHHLTNPSVNCFSARVTAAPIVSFLLCSISRFTYCTFGMDPGSRSDGAPEVFPPAIENAPTAVYSRASWAGSCRAWSPASPAPGSASCGSRAA